AENASHRRGEPLYATLIEPAQLAAALAEPHVAILDCRFELAQPEWGVRAYAAGHIPHALYANLDRDLAGSVHAGSGRHPLPLLEDFTRTLGHWGIDGEVQVIAYDQGSGAYAARLWWLLRWAGHTRAAVLNGGYAAWSAAALPVSGGIETRPARHFAARAPAAGALGTAEVARALAARQILLVDARSAERYAGQNETIDAVAGHVPG